MFLRGKFFTWVEYIVFMTSIELIRKVKIGVTKFLDDAHPHLFVRKEPRNTYVGSLEMSLQEGIGHLIDSGFRKNLASYLTYKKYYTEEGSFRRYRKGDFVYYPNGILGKEQVHVSLYSGFDDGYVDVYAHWERNWIRHPIEHLKGTDYDAAKGVGTVKEKLLNYLEWEQRDPETRYYG